MQEQKYVASLHLLTNALPHLQLAQTGTCPSGSSLLDYLRLDFPLRTDLLLLLEALDWLVHTGSNVDLSDLLNCPSYTDERIRSLFGIARDAVRAFLSSSGERATADSPDSPFTEDDATECLADLASFRDTLLELDSSESRSAWLHEYFFPTGSLANLHRSLLWALERPDLDFARSLCMPQYSSAQLWEFFQDVEADVRNALS